MCECLKIDKYPQASDMHVMKFQTQKCHASTKIQLFSCELWLAYEEKISLQNFLGVLKLEKLLDWLFTFKLIFPHNFPTLIRTYTFCKRYHSNSHETLPD